MNHTTDEFKRRRKALHSWLDDIIDEAEGRTSHRRSYNLLERFFNWPQDLLQQLIYLAVKAFLDKHEDSRKRVTERMRRLGQQLKRLIERP